MSTQPILVDATANTTQSSPTFISRTRDVLTIFASTSTGGAVSATVNVYQWLSVGGLTSEVKRLLATLTLTQAAPTDKIDLLNPAGRISADVIFSANPSSDRVSIVVEG